MGTPKNIEHENKRNNNGGREFRFNSLPPTSAKPPMPSVKPPKQK